MRLDIEKRIFFTKNCSSWRALHWFRELTGLNIRTKSVQLKQLYQISLENLIESDHYLICLQNPRMSERPVLRPELDWTFCSPKIRHYQSERHQLMSVFRILFAVIYFLKIYTVQISKCSPVTATRLRKKGYFCSMVARLGKEHLQVVNRFWWSILLFNRINQQQNNRIWLGKRPLDWNWKAAARWRSFGLMWDFLTQSLLTILFRKTGKSAQLLGNV